MSEDPPRSPDVPSWDRLVRDAAAFGVSLSACQVESLHLYLTSLCEWNRRFNLTAIEHPEEILTKHFLDSLACALLVDLTQHRTLLDVGSGAGFPGLVLKIAYPHLQVTLLDSLQKRLNFLERVGEELGLEGVRTLHARAEDAARPAGHAFARPGRAPAAPTLRECFDVVTARAVARLNVLAEWTLPFCRVGGLVLAMKGPGVSPEVLEADRAVRLLGGGPATVREFTLPRTGTGRSLVLIPKVKATPAAYPRAPGTARKVPL